MTAFSVVEDDVFVGPCAMTTNDDTMARHAPGRAAARRDAAPRLPHRRRRRARRPASRSARRRSSPPAPSSRNDVPPRAVVMGVPARSCARCPTRTCSSGGPELRRARRRPSAARRGPARRAARTCWRRRAGPGAVALAATSVVGAARSRASGAAGRRRAGGRRAASCPRPPRRWRETHRGRGDGLPRRHPDARTRVLNLLGSFTVTFAVGARCRRTSSAAAGASARSATSRCGGQPHPPLRARASLLAFARRAAPSIVDARRAARAAGWRCRSASASALTLDESALLLKLDDVYWTEEGIVSVQITFATLAMLVGARARPADAAPRRATAVRSDRRRAGVAGSGGRSADRRGARAPRRRRRAVGPQRLLAARARRRPATTGTPVGPR